MERAIRAQIEQLPEGVFLATPDELNGLVAQGRTVAETLEIARDVARTLIEVGRENGCDTVFPEAAGVHDLAIVVGPYSGNV